MQSLSKELNDQLEALNIILKTGVIVDASVINTPLKPNRKIKRAFNKVSSNKAISSKADSNKAGSKPRCDNSVDKEARWLKKNKKYYHGYQKHYVVSDPEGLVLSLLTTSANVNEISTLSGGHRHR